ncbi:DNA ligase 1-like protein [Drosera capensis]
MVSDHDNGADSKQLKPCKKEIDVSVSSDSGSKKSPRMRKSPEPESGNPNMESPKLSIKELIVKKDGGGDGSSKSESKKSPTKRKSPEPNPISGSPKKGKEVKKKGKVEEVNADERVANLKKMAGEFEARSAAWWEDKEKVPFLFVAKAFDLVANESGRLAITDIGCNLLRTVMEATPNDLLPVVYLLANKIAPTHKGLELGIGDASIIKGVGRGILCSIILPCEVLDEHQGDLGLVVTACCSSQTTMLRPSLLTVAEAFDTFLMIAKASGKDSQERKKSYMKKLLVAAKDCEPVYLIWLLQTKLRIGLAEQTLLVALGQASVYADKHSQPPSDTLSPLEEGTSGDSANVSLFKFRICVLMIFAIIYIYLDLVCKVEPVYVSQAAKIVKGVYSVLPVYDDIAPAILSNGVWELPNKCTFTPGVPIGPMPAKPNRGVSEIVEKFHDMVYTCEYKYDGERAQFPDVVVAVKRLKKPSVSSFVLDGELVAYDREKQKILPFQFLSTHARKNVSLSDIKVDVCIYAFDILYLNGKPLLHEQLSVRRELLYESFEEEPVNASCEGLIVKTLDREATYEPSKRSHTWLKLKKDYTER